MTPNIVYALKDPRTSEVRYIGQSSRGLERPKVSLEPLRSNDSGNAHRRNWLQAMRREGVWAEIEVLECFQTADDLNDAECFWIARGRSLGWPLTNQTKGGGGQRGFAVRPETIAKRIATRRERFNGQYSSVSTLRQETKDRIGQAHKGKKRPPKARVRMSEAQKLSWAARGGQMPEETRLKISATKKARRLKGGA